MFYAFYVTRPIHLYGEEELSCHPPTRILRDHSRRTRDPDFRTCPQHVGSLFRLEYAIYIEVFVVGL